MSPRQEADTMIGTLLAMAMLHIREARPKSRKISPYLMLINQIMISLPLGRRSTSLNKFDKHTHESPDAVTAVIARLPPSSKDPCPALPDHIATSQKNQSRCLVLTIQTTGSSVKALKAVIGTQNVTASEIGMNRRKRRAPKPDPTWFVHNFLRP